jgi:subtilisin family serine protease
MLTRRAPAAAAAAGLAVLIGAWLGLHPLSLSAQGRREATAFQRLLQSVRDDGTVGVIVRLDVPGITELTAASARFIQPDASRADTSRQMEVDAALKAAIDTTARALYAELRDTRYTVNNEYASIPFVALRVSAAALSVLRTSPRVLGIEEDLPVSLDDPEQGRPGNPLELPDVPQLDTSAKLVGAAMAWSWGYTGASWYVALLDSGIRSTHQFFAGKTIVEACFSKGADGTAGAGDCPNGSSSQTGAGSATPFPSSYYGYEHGTHVAGIAAGSTSGLAGIAKGANIIAIQVFSRFPSSTCYGMLCTGAWTSDSLAGLDWLYSVRNSYRVASANLSLGSGSYSSACDSDGRRAAIDNLRAAGIATAIAAGNDGSCGSVSNPACISTSVAVGASTDSDVRASYSNWNAAMVRLFAPGSSIYSATAASDTSYASMSGTSMAAPHVAGAFALLKQRLPAGTVTELLDALRASGVPIATSCDGGRAPTPRIAVDRAIASLGRYSLTIQVSSFGTTDPAPGVVGYPPGVEASVTALPDTYATFVEWQGDASGSSNPVAVVMDRDKSILASFRYIFPPVATGQKVENRSFSQLEYVNVLSWQPNSANSGLGISRYRVYKIAGSTSTLLSEVTGSQSAYEYRHRNAGLETATYAVAAVTSGNREGLPASVTIK